MGTVIALPSLRCATHAKTSERGSERAIKKGAGPSPRLFASGLSLEKAWIPPGTGRETTLQVLTCDGPNGTTYRCQRTPGPISQGRNGPPAGQAGHPPLGERRPARVRAVPTPVRQVKGSSRMTTEAATVITGTR